MDKIPYDFTRKSLYKAGEADDFFQLIDPAQIETDEVLCAEMARLAYVKEENRLAEYLGRAGFELHGTIGYSVKGTQVFIAKTKTSAVRSKLVITFRGTEGDDRWDILADAFLFKTPWQNQSKRPLGMVHRGFANALLKDLSSGDILATLTSLLAGLKDQYATILITGHSLGAALATLTATCLTPDLAQKIHLYTYGSPLVGNSDFYNQFESCAIKHERYVDCCDLVTCIPSTWLGFKHVGTLHYLDRNGQVIANIDSDGISADRKTALSEFSIDFSQPIQKVWSRRFSDHSPINYLSAVSGLRAPNES